MITDPYILEDDKKVSKVTLLFVDEDKKLCDGCNKRKKCASINDILNRVMIICKDCLQEIISYF